MALGLAARGGQPGGEGLFERDGMRNILLREGDRVQRVTCDGRQVRTGEYADLRVYRALHCFSREKPTRGSA